MKPESPCPRCGADWDYVGSDGRTYSHLIAVYDDELDRTVAWRCPDCGAVWQR